MNVNLIPKNYLDSAIKGVQDVLLELSLTQASSLRDIVALRPIKENSKAAYKKHLRSLRHYFFHRRRL